MRRCKLVQEIFAHCKIIGSNQTTLIFLLATLTDRGLTKFHKEYLAIKKEKK